jgi:hypothetical protein
MAKYEKDTRTVARTWLDRLASIDGAPVEVTKAMLLVAFDNMGKIGFTKEFGSITKGEGTRWLNLLSALFEQLARLGGLPWPVLVAKTFGDLGEVTELSNISAEMAEDRLQVGGSADLLSCSSDATRLTLHNRETTRAWKTCSNTLLKTSSLRSRGRSSTNTTSIRMLKLCLWLQRQFLRHVNKHYTQAPCLERLTLSD